ncbi:MAG TPA: methyltransferase domain-containing protein, partial [Vicinamibacteria bacterium]|nr:methyltransferase domain-containing protein [Vicinamibacteria bacterium]
SALILFEEMLLVRWVGTELRVFAYLQNGVLVAAFLGLGLGARSSRRPVRLLPALAALFALGVVIRDPLGWQLAEAVTQGLVAFQDSVIWEASGVGRAAYLRAPLVFFAVVLSLGVLAAVAQAFVPLGQWLGRWIDEQPRPIPAYTANILGSLAGIALFVAATVARWPPWAWLAVTAAGLVALLPWTTDRPPARAAVVALAAALPLLGWHGRDPLTVWSPYQKLAVSPFAPDGEVCGEIINVNNAGYQLLLDLDPDRMARLYPPGQVRSSHYVLPYELVGPRSRVLIVGAGAGNDAAAALRAGARSVQAVEIDPVIVDWGRERHPNRPYSSDRVTVTVEDARAFFRNDRGRYDLVWFGLLDSHTTPSAYSNVRLDHFVYTRESLADMKRLLAPGGVVVLFFEAQTDWIAGRLAGLLAETFGAPPLALRLRSASECLGWGGLLLIGGAEADLLAVRERAAAVPRLGRLLQATDVRAAGTRLTSDDWPYLYLRGPSLPRYHLIVAACSVALGLLLRRRLFRPGEPVDLPLLLLGAAFMLLEVTGVSRAALLFGTTWTVNAYVVAAILGMILLANLVASRTGGSATRWARVGLVLSLVALAALPTAWLAALPLPLRIVLGGGFLALPVFFAGIVFVTAWAASARRDLALGSNLLGALAGGVASLLSMVIGFRALALVTLLVYGAALALLSRRSAPPAPVAPQG